MSAWKGWDVSVRRLSMRSYLVLLVLAIMLPGAIFAGFLFLRYYNSEIGRLHEDLQADARQLALTIDRELAGLQSTLRTLAVSSRVTQGDFEGFYRQAEEVKSFVGVNILLRDVKGQQLVNTRVPWGTPLPFEPLAGDREVIDTKTPFVSGVIVGAVAQRPLYTITVPIIKQNRVAYLLNLSVELSDLARLLNENIKPGEIAGVYDRARVVMARSDGIEGIVGKPAPSGFAPRGDETEGLWRGVDVRGQTVRAAFARSKLADWWVWVSVPDEVIVRPIREALETLGLLGGGLALAALFIAYAVGGRLASATGRLATEAAALGRGEEILPRQTAVRELNEIGQALTDASVRLRERARERDEAERDLLSLSETLERKVSERTHDLVEEMQRREETEAVLRQSQKMEAIGQLTGGIAHDFNNMLAVVLGSVDLAARRLEKGDAAIGKYLTNAREGAQRAASLTQRLLAFARQQPLMPKSEDINRLVAEMSDLLRRSLGETVKLETVLAGGLWRTYVDPNQLENAVLNLAVNARDAMPDGGKLTIETANAHLDDEYAIAHSGIPAGQYVLIAITDTGVGMPPEVIERAFDPFFTTKTGLGTGLGLSQVYGFVRQSGGHVKIYSEVGEGTTIKIYLPRYFGADAERTEAARRVPLPTNDGSVSVLVVEDEEGVRMHAVEALNELGYKVFEAESGTAALKVLDTNSDIDILFTDVVMPDMNGRRLAEEVTRRRPSIKVLYTTGYTRNAIVHNGMLDPGVSLLSKPFTLEQLARKIADVLKEKRA
jgi:signal transduction histidine kinase/CheY-like chemotaxis protein